MGYQDRIVVSAYVPAVDVAVIDALADKLEAPRSRVIRKAIAQGLLAMVAGDPDLEARYRRALDETKKRKAPPYDPSILGVSNAAP
jgi:hypothetical protein